MSESLILVYVGLAIALVVTLVFHARLTVNVRLLLNEAPLVPSRLDLPSGVDLRPVLTTPRLSFFALALLGTVIRVVLTIVVVLALDASTVRIAWPIVAVGMILVLALPEILMRLTSTDTPRMSRVDAEVLRLVARGASSVGGSSGDPGTADTDALAENIVTSVDGHELFDPELKRYMSGLLALKRLTAARAMVPRSELVTVREDWSVSRAVAAIGRQAYARIPVVGRTGDIVGLVHTKDLLLLKRSYQSGTFVKSVMRDVLYIPANQRLDSLLHQFQNQRLHVAVVLDEYGRSAGLITMDDLLRRALSESEP